MIHILTKVFFASFFTVVAAVSTSAGNNSGAAFSTWPDTGQAKCYDYSVEILCPAEDYPFHGQDAQYSGPVRSYTLLGGTMVQDNVTGLIWEVKTSLDGTSDYNNPNDADNTYTWCDPDPETNGGSQGSCGDHDTKDFIDQLNSGDGFGGYTDWRLPTIKELASLIDRDRTEPAIDPLFASTTKSFFYWSSTARANGYELAWLVAFGEGDVTGSNKTTGCNVRAVRVSQ